ncbi:MAG: cell division ATP-binding protein FtsE [Candidatus Kerfeldbacteria bacterium]|nr:cell division ATP-binding protein FtsE [Candidatus Kerfeldbacteria bacterium]
MVTFEHVTKTYQRRNVGLEDVSVNIEAGEFVSIVGQSGSGKTTFAKLIIAEEKADKGHITIGGWNITHIKHHEIPTLRRQIGVVFQDFKLLPKKTLFENVAFALEVAGERATRIKSVVPQVLKIVGLEQKMDRYPDQVSGGEQQRVVIARALVHRPKLLVADEPTGNLDSINAQEIIALLKKINEFGTTVVLVTHNREIVNMLHKRVITLDHGHVIADQQAGKYLL